MNFFMNRKTSECVGSCEDELLGRSKAFLSNKKEINPNISHQKTKTKKFNLIINVTIFKTNITITNK